MPAGDASPLLCIVVPTIPGRESLLSRCLWSITEQWQPGVQVLCIDGSGHFGDKINLAAHTTSAKYMVVVDDDDYLDGAYLASVLPALQADPDFVGYRILVWLEHKFSSIAATRGDRDRFDHDGSQHGPSQKGVTRTSIWRQVPFGNRYTSDRAWMSEVSPLIQSHAFVDRVLYVYDCQPSFSAFVGSERSRDIGVWPYDPSRVEWLTSN